MNLNKIEFSELANSLVQGTIDINELNLKKENNRQGFLLAIEKRPNLLKKVKEENRDKFLELALKTKPEYFIYLDKEQYTDKLAQVYLESRLTNNDKNKKNVYENDDITIQKSFDDKLVFNYNYTSAQDEEFYYFDNELQVPTSIKSSIKITLKIVDAIAFIKGLDTTVAQIGENKIKNMLTETVVSKYRAFFNVYVASKKTGFYSLCASTQDIEEQFKQELGKDLAPFGIEVSSFIVKKIAIPADLQHKIEDLAFDIRQRRESIMADDEFAKNSLKNYEAKLSIQQKYPDAEVTLTEYEKDLALKRYLIKKGRMEETEIDREIKLVSKVENVDKAIDKQDDIIPQEQEKMNSFKTAFILLLFVSILVSSILFTVGAGVALIAYGVTVGIFGTVLAFNYDKMKKAEDDQNEEDIDNVDE